jgi:hypothetical protein
MSAHPIDLEGRRRTALARILQFAPLAVRRVLGTFLISRALIVLILTATPLVAQVRLAQWNTSDTVSVSLSRGAVATGLRNVALGNDAGWYYTIAHDGYEKRPFDTTRQTNWAFFPFHPLLWRGAANLTGEWLWSGVLLSNACFLIALALLWQLARTLTQSERLADHAAIFASFWPASYFSMLPHTEALFFVLTCLSALASAGARWGVAGIAGAFASATRFNGLFLAPMAFMDWLNGDRRPVDLLKIAPVAAGAAAYMAYLWAITGNPFAFKDIQTAWGRELSLPWKALWDYLGRPHKLAVSWNPRLLHFGITILGICSIVTCWKKGWRGLAVFTALTLLAPMSTGTLTSMTRYVGVAPGVYLALAVWSDRSPRFAQICTATFAVALTLLCVMLGLGINIAGA